MAVTAPPLSPMGSGFDTLCSAKATVPDPKRRRVNGVAAIRLAARMVVIGLAVEARMGVSMVPTGG